MEYQKTVWVAADDGEDGGGDAVEVVVLSCGTAHAVVLDVEEQGCVVGQATDVLLNILPNTSDRAEILTAELNRIYPKLTPDDIIPYGKYKGMTFRRIYSEDPDYISWFINNTSVDIDENAFRLMFK